ncbi:ATP-binding cassette domain-containing protein [Bifidobacterium vespertilionis]|uniref:ATP-binding cassette domain-containing protein n=1 Tax=Bifidobacterium vespertilionis TaxID=2562524 RepID=UPI001BDD38CF|nr:ATP-binding cassette domain-containing protein [Bifidobacterium vespertilionis]MBT1179047.1 ATP-binding cassette domain-containing protein [Bifidobacterium vespertilionis]
MPINSTARTDTGCKTTGGDDRRVTLDDVGHGFQADDMLYRHISLALLPRHVYALTGPSGSGKSTLLSIIAGWQTPTEGHVERHGIHRVGWVFQNPHGTACRTVLDHIALPFIAQGNTRSQADEQARDLLKAFGLSQRGRSLFRDLSGGEAQRLMLARGVASRAELLLVDEPTAQLDPNTSQTVNTYLDNVSLSGAIVVVATHDSGTRDACTDVIDLKDYQ